MTDICLQSFQPRDTIIKHFYRSSQCNCCTSSILSNYTSTYDDDFRWGYARNSSKQHALAVICRAEILSRNKHYRTSCNFTHAANYWKSAAIILEIFKCNCSDSFLHHLLQKLGL